MIRQKPAINVVGARIMLSGIAYQFARGRYADNLMPLQMQLAGRSTETTAYVQNSETTAFYSIMEQRSMPFLRIRQGDIFGSRRPVAVVHMIATGQKKIVTKRLNGNGCFAHP